MLKRRREIENDETWRKENTRWEIEKKGLEGEKLLFMSGRPPTEKAACEKKIGITAPNSCLFCFDFAFSSSIRSALLLTPQRSPQRERSLSFQDFFPLLQSPDKLSCATTGNCYGVSRSM